MELQRIQDTVLILLKAYHWVTTGEVKLSDLHRWIWSGNIEMEKAEKIMLSGNFRETDSQELQASMCLLKSVLLMLKNERRKESCGIPVSDDPLSTYGDVIRIFIDRIVIPVSKIPNQDSNSEYVVVVWNEILCTTRNRIKTWVITNLYHFTMICFVRHAKLQFQAQIKKAIEEESNLKVNVVLTAEYITMENDTEDVEVQHFSTKAASICSTTDLQDWFHENIQKPINISMDDFQELNPEQCLLYILNLTINVDKFNPTENSSLNNLSDFINSQRLCVLDEMTTKNFKERKLHRKLLDKIIYVMGSFALPSQLIGAPGLEALLIGLAYFLSGIIC